MNREVFWNSGIALLFALQAAGNNAATNYVAAALFGCVAIIYLHLARGEWDT